MAKKDSFSYNQAIKEIETILSEIEGGELDVDELSVKIKKASELMKKCKLKLRTVEREVENILSDMEEEDKE